MTSDFDVIVIGSGPAGVSVAFPLVESGLRVLMVDGGKKSDVPLPTTNFLSARTKDAEQWKWLIGKDFHALKMRDVVSPKLRVPSQGYVFDEFEQYNKIIGKNFNIFGSLATGGLSNAWGCGVSRFSGKDMTAFPFPESDLEPSYAEVCQRVGISGGMGDDLSDYFGLDKYTHQPSIPMDSLHARISQCYDRRRKKFHSRGFRMGRPRVTVFTKDAPERQACDYSGNCLWGCRLHSLYSSADDLPKLRQFKNFSEMSGFVVDGLKNNDGIWFVEGQNIVDHERKSIQATRVVLAAGTLATTRLTLKALNFRSSVRLLSCPTAAFLLWLPSSLGAAKEPGFGLAQLSFTLALRENITVFGSTFPTTSLLRSEFVRHVPLQRRYAIDLLKGLMSSCVVGNLFLPGHLTTAEARLNEEDSLVVTGRYSDEVLPLMEETKKKLRRIYWRLGALLLPDGFTIASPGADIHYAGTLPMQKSPRIGETSQLGEVASLDGLYVVDGACLPCLPGKSHTLTIMANANRIGVALAKRLKS